MTSTPRTRAWRERRRAGLRRLAFDIEAEGLAEFLTDMELLPPPAFSGQERDWTEVAAAAAIFLSQAIVDHFDE
jgi:hypothetical protein